MSSIGSVPSEIIFGIIAGIVGSLGTILAVFRTFIGEKQQDLAHSAQARSDYVDQQLQGIMANSIDEAQASIDHLCANMNPQTFEELKEITSEISVLSKELDFIQHADRRLVVTLREIRNQAMLLTLGAWAMICLYTVVTYNAFPQFSNVITMVNTILGEAVLILGIMRANPVVRRYNRYKNELRTRGFET